MEKVLSTTTFERERNENAWLSWWTSRPHDERIAEVERLRREYVISILRRPDNGSPEGLRRSLLIVEREGSQFPDRRRICRRLPRGTSLRRDPVFYLGRDATIANKLAAGRAKDLADVEALSPSRSDERDLS